VSVLEGVNLYAYGHSYLALDYYGMSPQQRYINRVGRRLGMNVVNRATGGWFMQDAASDAIGTRRPWGVGTPGVVVIDATTNNARKTGASVLDLRGYEHALRALTHYVSLDTKLEDDNPMVGRAGGYIGAHVESSNGHNFRIPAGKAGHVTVNNLPWPKIVVGLCGIVGASGAFEVMLNGQLRATVATGGQTVATATGRRNSTPIAVPLDAGPGVHSVHVRPAGGGVSGANGPFLDYVGRLAAAPPRIFVVKGVPIPGVPASVFDQYNALIDEVAGELPNVTAVDPRPGWDVATMVGADQVHATARGHAHIADALEAAIAAGVTDFSTGVTR
jgi:hypothetical protein